MRSKMWNLELHKNNEIQAAKKQAIDNIRKQPKFAKWASKPFDQQGAYGEENEYDRGIRTTGESADFYVGRPRILISNSRVNIEEVESSTQREVDYESKRLGALQYEYHLWTQTVSIPGARLIA